MPVLQKKFGSLRALGVLMTATMLAGCSPTAGPRIIKHVPAVAKGEVQEVQGEVKVSLQPRADAWVDNRLQAFAKEQRELC